MSKSITLQLPQRVESALVDATREEGLSQDEIVVAALDDYLFSRKFRGLWERMMSEAPREYTDGEIFETIS